MLFNGFALLSLLAVTATVNAATTARLASGSGKTTRYWDCCKGSCGWDKKAQVSHPITSCGKNDQPLSGYSDKNACDNGGGQAYMCTNQSPWAVNDTLALGFAAAKLAGGNEGSWCCACYKLTFKSGPVQGKTMIVQTTNTGGDLGNNHFDIAMPGGGVGIFNACSSQFGAPSSGWGQQYGGVSSKSACDSFPAALKAGCNWRFDWFKGADNPDVDFTEITCPSELTAKTGCVRQGSNPVPVAAL